MRTAALAQGWRDLWKSRWAHPTSCRDIHLRPGDHPKEVLASLERGPRRRLDRFSLVVDNQKFRPPHLRRLLAYAAECRVEDLHVDLRGCRCGPFENFNFQLARASPLLTHLSLRRIGICGMYFKGAQPLYALEVIRLQSVTIGVNFSKITALCPRLHTIDVRHCHCDDIFYGATAFVPPAGANLRSVTVAECSGDTRLNAAVVPSLRSFRYSGSFLGAPFFLPDDAALTDLYMRFRDREDHDTNWYSHDFDKALPSDLSGLAVLTICSKALKLQLLVFGMQTSNLADIYVFLKAGHCPCLERLFVHLQDISDVPLVALLEEVGVEPPEDGLHNLRVVKVMNFNWRRFEAQLVSFLLRKASSLHKLLLVSPNVTPLHVPGVQEADLLLIEEALANGRVILSDSDDAAIQSFHSEVFIMA
ncbi:hypothetical protein ACP70R_043983 [Stipagrostis hirtigluma subsp. patula]